MGNFLTLDEPMGPGFLIFFKKVKKSGDWVNVRPPRRLYEGFDHDISEIPRFKEIIKKSRKLIKKVTEVEKAVDVLKVSKHVPSEVKELIETRDLVGEVTSPQVDSDYVLMIIMQWCLVIQVLRDDEEAILVLMIS